MEEKISRHALSVVLPVSTAHTLSHTHITFSLTLASQHTSHSHSLSHRNTHHTLTHSRITTHITLAHHTLASHSHITLSHHTLIQYRSSIVPPITAPSSLLRVISSVAFRAGEAAGGAAGEAAGEAPCPVERQVTRWPYQERSF